jgi:hypothetical protein
VRQPDQLCTVSIEGDNPSTLLYEDRTSIKRNAANITSVDPQVIQQAVNDCIKSLNNDRARVIKKLGSNSTLYQYEKDINNGLFFLATDKTIDYLVRYKTVELSVDVLPHRFASRQVLIKRFPTSSIHSAQLGADVFWNYLFPRTKCLVSDTQQTVDGKSFWEYRIKEAFEKGLNVRLINTNDNTFEDVTNAEELHQLSSTIWGPSKWFQRIVLAIM